MFTIKLLIAAHLTQALALGIPRNVEEHTDTSDVWVKSHFKSLVTFGDSLTDGGLAEAIMTKVMVDGEIMLEPGTPLEHSTRTPNGGRSWTSYVTQYVQEDSNQKLELYNYAIAGAVCNSEIVPIMFEGLDFAMPGVIDYELPMFQRDLDANRLGTDEPYFNPPLDAESTVYAVWIGHNDLGNNGFISNKQAPGYTIQNVTNCVFESFDEIYRLGGRLFVVGTLLPLELTPLYANKTLNGLAAPSLWPEKEHLDQDLIANGIRSLTNAFNNILKYQTPFELKFAERYPDAHFAVFDGNSVIRNIYHNPTQYLNGTIDPVIQRPAAECALNELNLSECKPVGDAIENPDAFMWFDDIHATEQTHRVLAREFVKMLDGESNYTTYYST